MDDGKFVSLEHLKSFIVHNNKINYNFDDENAMLVSILEQVMAFVRCESCSILIKGTGNKNLLVSLGSRGSQTKCVEIGDGSIASWVMEHGQSVVINRPASDQRFFSNVPAKSLPRNLLASPVSFDGDRLGIIEVFNSTGHTDFDNSDIEMLELLGIHAGATCKRFSIYQQKKEILSLSEIPEQGGPYLVGKSPIIQEIERTVGEVAKTNTSVLISGERGAGKSVFALRLHFLSARKNRPFLYVNCASGSAASLDEKIFGTMCGGKSAGGLLSDADGGTLFLDGVGALPLEIQEKILGLIQDGSFAPAGGNGLFRRDIRVVASTVEGLETLVHKGTFREDLCYMLNVLPLNIPPLRKHSEDIVPLAEFFLEKFSRDHKKKVQGFSTGAIDFLEKYSWPGNISELKNAVEGACLSASSILITEDDFSGPNKKRATGLGPSVSARIEAPMPDGDRTLKTAVNEFKKEYIKKILSEENWNQSSTARVLDVQRTYVSRLIAELGIKRGAD